MPKAIEQTRSGLTVGHASLGASVARAVHDGDTLTLGAVGSVGVRFLGVDAPEISFRLPTDRAFKSTANPSWEAFLADPLDPRWGPMPDLERGLLAHLEAGWGAGAALNQHRHAVAAEKALEDEVRADMAALGQDGDSFRFFTVFAFEVMDRYGRLLGYINREQASSRTPSPRPLSYNERLLRRGLVAPYFIWPNVDPFRARGSKLLAVLKPGSARDEADRSRSLRNALAWVHEAREEGIGLFEPADALRLQPFELRFLANRRAPDRFVIDLDANSKEMIHPERYYTILKPENRLFIPPEYRALFESAGWKAQKR